MNEKHPKIVSRTVKIILCAMFLTGFCLVAGDTHSAQASMQDSKAVKPPLPPVPQVKYPADDPETIRITYEFAAEHPEVLNYIPCYCLCSRTEHHRSNEDCFVKERHEDGSVVWTPHAAECMICMSVAKEARSLYLKGESVKSIRDTIEKDFGTKFKNRTDTPEPPSDSAAATKSNQACHGRNKHARWNTGL